MPNPVTQASSPAGSGGVSPPFLGTRTETVLGPTCEAACRLQNPNDSKQLPKGFSLHSIIRLPPSALAPRPRNGLSRLFRR